MQRHLVQIARIRIGEVVPGDVVNRVPDENRGWFVVALVEELFDGSLQISDVTRQDSFSSGPMDIVGVQLLKPVDLPVNEEVPEIADGGVRSASDEEAKLRAV
jgi:hypothetical protein